jgi:hypothetical protein
MPQAWEGEGLTGAHTLTRPPLRVGHPLPRCGRGVGMALVGVFRDNASMFVNER